MVTWEYVGGIFLILIATTLFNLSPIIQKEALDKMSEVSVAKLGTSLKMMFTNKRWLGGMLLGVAGGLPYFFSMMMIGAAVVQPLIAFGYIVLVIAANRMLNEKLNLSAKIAIFFMIIMPIFIAVAEVSNAQTDFTLPESQLSFFIFVVVCLAVAGICLLLSKKYSIAWAPVTGIIFSLGAISLQGILSVIASAGYDLLPDIGLILKNLFIDKNLIAVFFMIIGSIVFNAVAGFVMVIGLQKNAAAKFTPINQTINNMLTIVAGLTVFGQVVGSWLFYGIALVLAVVGTIILSQYQLPTKEATKNPSL